MKAFLYANNEISETETRKKKPFAIATRKRKYLGINLTKEVKDLYSENYRTLKKEIKEDAINGSIYHVHGLEELTSSKCPYYPKQFIDSTQSLLKYQCQPWQVWLSGLSTSLRSKGSPVLLPVGAHAWVVA